MELENKPACIARKERNAILGVHWPIDLNSTTVQPALSHHALTRLEQCGALLQEAAEGRQSSAGAHHDDLQGAQVGGSMARGYWLPRGCFVLHHRVQ